MNLKGKISSQGKIHIPPTLEVHVTRRAKRRGDSSMITAPSEFVGANVSILSTSGVHA